MSLIIDIDDLSEGDPGTTRERFVDCLASLGSTYKEKEPQHEAAENFFELTDGGDVPEIAAKYAQSLRKQYQRKVLITDRGSPSCGHCVGEELKAKRDRGRNAELSKELAALEVKDGFVYDALPDAGAIRVLVVEPALDHDAPLYATLNIELSRKTANYSALSYTWGGIDTNGVLHIGHKIIEITGNLDLALRSLRSDKEPLRIWVDAVCINQNNLTEKATQVASMDETYKNAKIVIAWLGPASDTSQAALESCEIIAELSKAPEYDMETAEKAVEMELSLPDMDNEVASDIQEMRSSSGIEDLLKRLWFSRLWIVQECVLAQELIFYVGEDTITWSQLRRAVKMMWAAERQFISFSSEPQMRSVGCVLHFMYLVDMRDKARSFGEGAMLFRDYTTEMYGKIRDLWRWNCKDERDRVYAILGFKPKESSMHITPDYTLDARQVYIQFAREHIIHEGLMILMYAGLEQRGGKGLVDLMITYGDRIDDPDDYGSDEDFLDRLGLPSWVPDLRAANRAVQKRYWNPVNFSATMSRSPAAVLHSACPHILSVRGKVFDSISDLHPPDTFRNEAKAGTLMDYIETASYMRYIWTMTQEFYRERDGHPTGRSIEDVFDNVVTVEYTTQILAGIVLQRGQSWAETMLTIFRLGTEVDTAAEAAQLTSQLLQLHSLSAQDIFLFWSSLSPLFLNDQVIFTAAGYIGIAPKSCRLDKIAWINELQCLVVLRPLMEHKDQYQLVGPCYIYGLMHEELAEWGTDEDVCSFIDLV